MPATYHTLPLAVQAIRYTGANQAAIADFAGCAWRRLIIPDGPDLEVATVMGAVRAQPGDWLIRGWHDGWEVQADAMFTATHQIEEP